MDKRFIMSGALQPGQVLLIRTFPRIWALIKGSPHWRLAWGPSRCSHWPAAQPPSCGALALWQHPGRFLATRLGREDLRPAARAGVAPGRLGSPCGKHMGLNSWAGMGAQARTIKARVALGRGQREREKRWVGPSEPSQGKALWAAWCLDGADEGAQPLQYSAALCGGSHSPRDTVPSEWGWHLRLS